MQQSLLAAIQDKSARIGIIGLGYVGLPLANAFINAGFTVLGFDVDQAKVDRLAAGESYIKHISSETVSGWLSAGQFEATSDQTRMSEADALLICVPTPLSESRGPDLQYVEGTARAIAATLRPGQLVVLESTTYPTTTRNVVLPLLAESGLSVGSDNFLAYSPEREDPGNPDYSAAGIPKVVGGIDEPSGQVAAALYEQAIVQVVPVGSPEVAEACKILENTYRAVNIALVNELKTLLDRMEIDIWDVINAAKTKPFGFMPFQPGPGLGGHCIPIDPFYLTWRAREFGESTRFIELAGEINRSMPQFVLEKIQNALNDQGKSVRGSRSLIIGLAYKPDVNDCRESPAFELMNLLHSRGAKVRYFDPYVPSIPATRRNPHWTGQPSIQWEEAAVRDNELVVIITHHTNIHFD